MPSLTQTEARTRAELITVHDTVVDLDLTEDGDTFVSTVMITFDCARPGAGTFCDFHGERLRSARLNGRALPSHAWADGRLALDDLEEHNELVVSGEMRYAADGEGLCRHVDPADGRRYLYAMSFLDAAPKWFCCFDQPDLKSSYRLEVRAPEEWTVHGNGPSTVVAPGHWRIEPPTPLSTYFVTLIAGPYASVYAEHDGIPLGLHVRASLGAELAAEADDILTITRQAFDHYHRLFGVRYPFGEYHQAFVPDFNAGAMENPGCVTFRDQFIFRARATRAERAGRAATIAHEMAHMWFGDLVTMRWWDDLWLNESFAEYLAHRTCAAATDYPMWTEFGIARKQWGMVADQAPSTHPVAGNGAEDAASALAQFDGISYAKGAAVLQQLAAYLGDEVFLAGLRSYFDEHRFGNAAFADLMRAWTAAGARDLDTWARAWLRTSGPDRLEVTDGDRGAVLVRTGTCDLSRPHAISVVALDADGAATGQARMVVEQDRTPLVLDPVGDPGRTTVSVLPDARDATWARVRPLGGWDALPTIAALDDPLTRTVCYRNLFDAVRAAELAPGAALGLLLDAAPSERDDVLLRAVLQFATDPLATSHCPPGDRGTRRARVRGAAEQLLAEAAPGSDRQLLAFRAYARVLDDEDLLDRLLHEDGLPDRLPLDAELRWSLVHRLATVGDPRSAEQIIDATAEADRSAAGRVHATRARALLARPEAKAWALGLVVAPSDLTAYEVYAAAEGLFPAEQHDLTRPWAEEYFARIAETARFRAGWALPRVATTAFPLCANDDHTLALARRLLGDDDLDPALRRALVDATDRLGRAVASVRLDAADGGGSGRE